jgi:8-oxo-dGTP pyrophosphatase MutT (NUDIX family)
MLWRGSLPVGTLGPGALDGSAVMLDPVPTKIRFTGRIDNSQLCLPGGRLEVGERVAATCLREVLEATGWEVRRSHPPQRRLAAQRP